MKKKTQCVLFIDDDKATNFFNKRVAKNHGFFNKIVSVQSGFEGLDYLKASVKGLEQKPDLIFLDINMPAMNGWEFLKEFHNLDKNLIKGIDIVILSTSTDPNDIDEFNKNESLIDFVNKPINLNVLNNVLQKSILI